MILTTVFFAKSGSSALDSKPYLRREASSRTTFVRRSKAYIQLTEAEAAFRIHKSDLSLRQIWHQKEEHVLAHIFVCFVAYVLWKNPGRSAQRRGSATNPAESLPNSPISAQWTWCCQPVPARDPKPLHFKTDGPPADPSRKTRPQTASQNNTTQKCSGDF